MLPSMLDAMRLGARLGGELASLGWDAVRGRSSAVPGSIDEVDAAWLQGAMVERFAGIDIDGIDVLDGTVGTTERRRIAFRYSGASRDGWPTTAFVKVRPPGTAERLFGNLFSLGANEVAFYRDIRPALRVRVPECYAARAGRGGRFALVLEDLASEVTTFPTIAEPITLAQAASAVSALTQVHAACWGPDIAARLSWLRTPERTRNEAVERAICERAHRPTLARFGAILPESLRRGAARIHAERPTLERYWADAPRTLIHGDSHAGNLFFDGDEVGLLDWQVAQHHHGVRDIAYFLILSLDTELRRAHERALLRDYLDELRALGVPEAETREAEAWDRYRSFSLYAYIATSVTATLSTLQPEPIARLGLERAATAVDDLDALALLERIAR